MNQLQAMRVFLKVAESGSFVRAATSLKLSKAVITRYVGLLESHLKVRLLNRSTRGLSLTEAGKNYAIGCRRVLEEVEQMEASASSSATDHSGTLKVVVAAALAPVGLTALLQLYQSRFPKTSLQVTLSHQPVDLVDDGFDAGIVLPRFINNGSLINRPLLTMTSVAVASPEYIQQRGLPASPKDLAQHAVLDMLPDSRNPVWTFDGEGGSRTVAVEPVYTINSTLMLRQAALAGMGIAILPQTAIAEDFASGALVRVLPAYSVRDANSEVSIVYLSRHHMSARTRSFVDFTLEHFRECALAA